MFRTRGRLNPKRWTRALSDRVRGTAFERVLRDADRRSQLLQAEGFTAGYNNGKFIIQSADGNFLLHPWLQFQFRSTTNARDNAGGGDAPNAKAGNAVAWLAPVWTGR